MYLPAIEGSIRLADGLSANEGRVEIYNYGEWGTVCDDDWDTPDAAVVCRQLGFPGVELAFTKSLFGGGTGRSWMMDVRCSGTEQMLSKCAHAGWEYSNICDHTEDAGVRCLVDAGKSFNSYPAIMNTAQYHRATPHCAKPQIPPVPSLF